MDHTDQWAAKLGGYKRLAYCQRSENWREEERMKYYVILTGNAACKAEEGGYRPSQA
jgi:hypothetical protein